ncbi:Clp domain containing protein [Nitzschia inconspicua]|uniref:Clp domain containing protein n=1 Tax=Nitzschia inconspicua TaxID=303405 RepID=A0A9K3PKD3_9STRA|nr:Clp domain containing protein [Nitzschia inconspicua]KAG7349916.1 Clp domain containing protein [Nitzschia inconspicua]
MMLRIIMIICLWCALWSPAVCLAFSHPPRISHRIWDLSEPSSATILRHRRESTSSSSLDDDDKVRQDFRIRIRDNSSRCPGLSSTTTVQNVLVHSNNLHPTVLPERVHIVVFPSQNGAHSVEFPKGSGNNVIMAFASEQACHNFAVLLKKQNFFDPSPQQFCLDDLLSLSESLGVFVQIIPEGIDLIPPTQNVKSFGLSSESKDTKQCLSYLFDKDWVDEEEEEPAFADDGRLQSGAVDELEAIVSIWE